MSWLAAFVRHRNFPFRLLLLAFFLFPFLGLHLKGFHVRDSFVEHFESYLTGNVINNVIQDNWLWVVLSIVLFMAFLIPLSFRRKAKWAERGLVAAFFISLFIEMYGIPFTILFAQKYFYQSDADAPENFWTSPSLLGQDFGMDLAMAWSALLMIAGTLIVVVSWITLYRGVKKNKESLVTKGIYSYSRHPQYLGFLLVIVGWMIGWPTIITLVLAPILVFMYVRASRKEEKEVPNQEEYQEYKKRTPFFI